MIRSGKMKEVSIKKEGIKIDGGNIGVSKEGI